MHFLAIAAGGIRTALFSSGPPSLSFSGPSEMPGLPSFCDRLSLKAKPDPQTKRQKWKKRTGLTPARKRKKKKVGGGGGCGRCFCLCVNLGIGLQSEGQKVIVGR